MDNLDLVATIAETTALAVLDNMPDNKLPALELLNLYKLNSNRIIWLNTSVDEYILEQEKQILLWNIDDLGLEPEKRQPILLVIFNYGGDLDVCNSMISVIEKSKTPVYALNLGVAASAAGLIFMACKKRFIMPLGTVLIHGGSVEASGNSVTFVDAANNYKKTLNTMYDFIIKHTSITKQMLTKKKANDWTLSAEECIKYNVADKIVDSLDDVLNLRHNEKTL